MRSACAAARLSHARDHGVAASLAQMTLLQSAIFDSAEMAEAIAGWKDKRAAAHPDLVRIAGER